jgi:hypothetical protein
VHSYSKDGAMRIHNVSDPVYAPNSKGGPKADTARERLVNNIVGHLSLHFIRQLSRPGDHHE